MKRSPLTRKTPLARGNNGGKRTWVCENCGRSFEAKQTHLGARRYCSTACSGAAKAKPVTVPCPVCGREVLTTARTRRKTCSDRCAREAKALAKRGRLNPNYSASGNTKRRWHESKGRECLMCGARTRLQLHHVVFEQHVRAESGDPFDPRDGVTLCVSCHTSVHRSGRKPLTLWMLPDAAIDFAADLYGPGAYDYLRRRYGGEDPRVDALLTLPVRSR